jgi:magnesium transporter
LLQSRRKQEKLMAENQTLDNAPAIDPDEPWLALRSAIEAEDKAQLTAIFDELTLSEGLRALLQLEAEERARVLTLPPPELAAELIEEAPNPQAVELVEGLDAKHAAGIVEELHSDIQADLVGASRPHG